MQYRYYYLFVFLFAAQHLMGCKYPLKNPLNCSSNPLNNIIVQTNREVEKICTDAHDFAFLYKKKYPDSPQWEVDEAAADSVKDQFHSLIAQKEQIALTILQKNKLLARTPDQAGICPLALATRLRLSFLVEIFLQHDASTSSPCIEKSAIYFLLLKDSPESIDLKQPFYDQPDDPYSTTYNLIVNKSSFSIVKAAKQLLKK
jgi:hypothetical protein